MCYTARVKELHDDNNTSIITISAKQPQPHASVLDTNRIPCPVVITQFAFTVLHFTTVSSYRTV